jgi:hypothetical protein
MGTPAAPEAFDDETPLVPVVDVSLQKDTSSVLFVNPSFPAYRSSQTQVNKFVQGVATTTTIHTVTTGKTFYCLGLNVGMTATAPAGVAVAGVTQITAPVLVNNSYSCQGGILFSATSGQLITIVHGGGGAFGYASIWGYEM